MDEDSYERWSKWQITMGSNPPSHSVKGPADIKVGATVFSTVTTRTINIPASFEIRIGTPIVKANTPPIEVPAIGESILSYLYPPERRESMLGDFEEGFRSRAIKHGLRAARRWYFWQVTRSVLECAFSLLRILVWIREALEKLGLW